MFKLDPSATTPVIFNRAELAEIFKSNKMYSNFKDPPDTAPEQTTDQHRRAVKKLKWS